MSPLMKFAFASGLCLLAGLGSKPALAQSTDGFHTIQIFPVVVDSATFTQRFTFRNPDSAHTATVQPAYYPATGTSQAISISCPSFVIPAGGISVFASLRAICPALAAGSQFGYLYTYENSSENHLYAGYSRVTNASGNGFSVEAFPAHTFTPADSVVTGIRRMAATASSPAFQTNCFIGNLNEMTPGSNPTSNITYTIYNSAAVSIGSGVVSLTPAKMTRLLDVFEAAGVPAGDYNDAYIKFREDGPGEPGLMTFCTVQDNSSFGADFRIGKQEEGFGTARSGLGAQDDHVSRNTTISTDIKMSGDTTARAFSIPASVVGNTHVIYFRHPDYVQCEIINPATGVRALAAYGLEMRMLDQNGVVMAGGNEIYGFGKIYTGDKTDRNNGANTRYTIEVESTETNTAAVRPYGLHCQSGSGHTMADIVRYNGTDRF